jgi:hypothetical protein
MSRSHGQICYYGGHGVWTEVLERTKYRRHRKAHGSVGSKRVARYARIHRLHALEMEELPICSTRTVSGPYCKKLAIILEAVTSQDLWVWHSFFGMLGSHNDIKVLQRSPLFARLCAGEASPFNYTINGHDYNMG